MSATLLAPDTAPAAAPAAISIRNVTKHFTKPDGTVYPALGPVSFEAAPGSFTAIVGPSGCGKSTLLNMVAGLAEPTSGAVLVDGAPVRGVNRGVGLLFQDDALLPWRTVEENVALGLRLRGVGRAESRERVGEWLVRVGLDGFSRHYPAQLSGGMRKRAAIAQTLIYEPAVILMDEPFAHLDAQARHLMQSDLLALCADGSRTILLVTHDLDEAIGLADRVVVLGAGPHSQVKAIEPVEIERPRDLLKLRSHPRFGPLSESLWGLLYEEVRRSYGR